MIAEREESNAVSSWQTRRLRSEGRWQLRHRARYIRSGERFLRELAVCEAATGLTFDVESTIASLHKLAPQLAEALLRACDTTESRAPDE